MLVLTNSCCISRRIARFYPLGTLMFKWRFLGTYHNLLSFEVFLLLASNAYGDCFQIFVQFFCNIVVVCLLQNIRIDVHILWIWRLHVSLIHSWGTKKDCLMEKWLQRTNFDFYNIYSIVIIFDCCMPTIRMMACSINENI